MKKILLVLVMALSVYGFSTDAKADYASSTEDSTAVNYGADPKWDNMPVVINTRRPRVGTIIQMPVGAMLEDESNGWLLCDGRVLNKDDEKYKNLFKVIGYTYGGTGSLFSIPDLMHNGDFLRGYKSGTSAKLGTRQKMMAHSPYTVNFWTMTQNTNAYGGSVKKTQTKTTHQIKVEQYSGLGTLFHDNETTSWGKRMRMTYNNTDTSDNGTGDDVRPTNYAVSYWIMAEGSLVNDSTPGDDGSEDTTLADAIAQLNAMQALLNQYYEELNNILNDAKNSDEEYQNRYNEYSDCQYLIDQAKALAQAAKEGKGLEQGEYSGNGSGTTSMPQSMADWMKARGLKYDTAGNDLYNSYTEWQTAIKSLENYQKEVGSGVDQNIVNQYNAKKEQIESLEAKIKSQQELIKRLQK